MFKKSYKKTFQKKALSASQGHLSAIQEEQAAKQAVYIVIISLGQTIRNVLGKKNTFCLVICRVSQVLI